MTVPIHLLDKYNSPVPRYTSYPPANHFKDTFTTDNFVQALIDSNKMQPENLSIYIHIPFCKRLCFYCGCNKISMVEDNAIKKYIDALKTEMKSALSHIDKSRLLSQIHFGGGTPNVIPVGYLNEITSYLLSEFKSIENPEVAIECNPAYLDREYLVALNKAGVNRFSLGIQDFDQKILKSVNREIPEIPVNELVEMIHDINPKAVINFDFIYGLPGQTVDSFSSTIDEAISIGPDRIVTFSYAHLPSVFKAQAALERKGLPSPEQKIELYLNTYSQMKSNGYVPIGMDHYVKPDDELSLAFSNHLLHRNFQGYCTRRTTGQVYAFGISSITQLENSYFQTTKSIEQYNESINQGIFPIEKGYILQPHEIIVREVIDELMCNKILDFNILAENLKIEKAEIKKCLTIDKTSLDTFAADGIINYSEDRIEITEIGILFIRNVAASLDPVFQSSVMNYSKSV
ncbi:MAG: Coproporphyrinogen-III oxidase [Ignavibacteria bacterium]|nr:Coproporphyrinogen-III oxidase [Ignavibacteria bacterium]